MPTRIGPGSRVAGYVIEEQVGAGGMAMVFRARDSVLGRTTALKVLAPALAADQEFRTRFLRESRAIAAVDQPHILTIYAAGEADGVLYIATRFVPGGDLAGLMRRAGGPLGLIRASALITQVASALDAAHAAGLVHRDVKPGNVLIDYLPDGREHTYLSDFGLSKAASSDTGLTAPGTFMGTPDYSAPEQITATSPASARSDQYSLACVAFTLLAGQVPYIRKDAFAVLYAHATEPVPAVTAIRGDLPAAVDAVLARGMAKDPADRYASCTAFAAALRAAGEPASRANGRAANGHAPARGTDSARRRGGRKAAVIGGAAAVAVVVAAVVAVALIQGGHSTTSAGAGAGPGAGASAGAKPAPGPSAQVAVKTVAVRVPGGDDLQQPVFSPDGTLVAGWGENNLNDIYVLSAATGMPVRTIHLPANSAIAIAQLAFSADDKTLTGLDSSVPGAVYRWNLATGQESTLISPMAATGGAGDSSTAVLSGDGTTMAILDSARNGVDVLNLDTGTRIADLADPDGVTVVQAGHSFSGAISLDENGGVVSIADPAGNIYVWSVSTRRLLATFHYDGNRGFWGSSPDGKQISYGVANVSQDGKLISIYQNRSATVPQNTVWDIATRSNVTPHGADWPSNRVGVWFSADGHVIATNRGPGPDLWDAVTGAHLAAIGYSGHVPGAGPYLAGLSADGRELLTDDANGHNYVWQITY
jgi:serine/threonine-protein kinase